MLDWKNGFLLILDEICTHKNTNNGNQIDSSTIDGNIEFVHSQYSCILSSDVTSVNSIFLSVKTFNNSDNFRFFPVIFDTCDVMFNWSISLVPPTVLVNLFEENMIIYGILYI